MENCFSITDVLKDANLLQYESALLEQGADDVKQLIDLPESDFQDLLHLIGMDTKPFHVLRFKKTLGRSNKTGEDIFSQASTVNTHTVTVYATQVDDPAVKLLPPHQINKEPSLASVPAASKELVLPAKKSRQTFFNSPAELQSLVDDSVPIQKKLVPSPISPDIWDEQRREIIRNSSQSFSEQFSGRELSPNEHLINEASFYLCLWDPTLLVRREELFKLAKKLVNFASSDKAGPVSSRKKGDKTVHKGRACPYPVNRGSDGKFKACFEMNFRLREAQMNEVERLLSENLTEQQVKQAHLVEAKQKKDYSAALKLQEEISALGQSYRHLKSEMSHIRKIQRRSIRHQEIKKLKKEIQQSDTVATSISSSLVTEDPTTSNSLSSSYKDTRSTSLPMITPDTLVEQMSSTGHSPLDSSSQDDDDSPLQLHSYIQDNGQSIV